MNNTKTSLNGLLLAAMLALPLAASVNTAAIAAEAPGSEKAAGDGPASAPPPVADGAPGMRGQRPGRDGGPDGDPPGGPHGGPHGGQFGGPIGSPFSGRFGGRFGGQFGGRFGGPGNGTPPFLRGLDLNEAQQDKVFAIVHGQEPALREQHKIIVKSHEALHQMTESGKYDDAKAVSLVQAETQAMAKITLQRLRSEQQILALLTAEQRKQMDEHRPRMGGMDGGPKDGPDGDHRPARPQ